MRCRGVAQPGSASALGAEGREFESLRPDHSFNNLEALGADRGHFEGNALLLEDVVYGFLVCFAERIQRVFAVDLHRRLDVGVAHQVALDRDVDTAVHQQRFVAVAERVPSEREW